MSNFPSTPEALTPAWLGNALGEAIEELATAPIADGAGVIGLVMRVRYRAGGKDKSVIAKFPSPAEANRVVAGHFNMYGREVHFYQDIAAHLPIRVPAPHFAEIDPASGDFLLIMEDLGDWRAGDQVAGASLQEARRIVTAIAEMHAATWNLPQPWLEGIVSHNNPAQREGMAAGFSAGWPVVEARLGELITASARAAAPRLPDRVGALLEQMTAANQSLVHADVRLDNVLFKDGAIALVDWQSVCTCCGEQDLAYFLTQSLASELLAAEGEALLTLYHDTLCAGGVTDYSLEQCRERYCIAALYLLCYAVTIAGTLDMGNERGEQLAAALLGRSISALDTLDAFALLD